jgi:hypothetical protein
MKRRRIKVSQNTIIAAMFGVAFVSLIAVLMNYHRIIKALLLNKDEDLTEDWDY